MIDSMNITSEAGRAIRVGAVCGILFVLCYLTTVAGILPDQMTMWCCFALGPLLIVGFFGIHRYCQLHQHRLGPQIALVFGIVSMALITLMLVVQLGNYMVHADTIAKADTEAAKNAANIAFSAVNRVQFLIDVAMDIFICLATILFGWAFFRHGWLDKVLGAIWGVVGLLLLVLNLRAFPFPPDSVGSFDAGPLLGICYVVVFVRLLVFTFVSKPSAELAS